MLGVKKTKGNDMKSMTEEQIIAKRYKRSGVTEEFVYTLVQSGVECGLSRKAALIGARMALGEKCGQQEYFTSEDIAEVLEITVEEANALIEENKDELNKIGGLAEVTSA